MVSPNALVIFDAVKTIVLIFILALSSPVLASNGGDEKSASITLSARVIDKHGEAVPGARIVIRETGQIFYSDFDGAFRIQLDKKSSFTFQVDMIGFEPKVVPSTQMVTGELTLTYL